MKAGLITFHKADNYGAVLQASALLKYINENICDCEIIDYLPNHMGRSDQRVLKKILRFGKKTVLSILEHNKSVKRKRFEKFRKKNYVLSENCYYGDEMIQSRPPVCDVLISGSDQILNLTLSKNSISYYLSFSDNAKKISYGSSFGRDNISEAEEQAIREHLVSFDNISVREKSAIDLLGKYIDANVVQVADPVFLMDKESWNNFIPQNKISNKKYILVYAMENNDVIRETVKSVEEKYKLPVIKISGGCSMDGIHGKEDKKCGPEQFLNYIRNAEFVITNSFHGMAFSHIFEKRFFAVAHTSRNARIESLLQMSDNFSKIISNVGDAEDVSRCIDGGQAYEYMGDIIKFSKKYLTENIVCKETTEEK